MRTDAARNRARILETAQALFAERGAAIDMAQLAAHAGVGVGTLYRHFATKEVLFEALVAERIAGFTAELRSLAVDETFFALLERFIEMHIGNRHLCEAFTLSRQSFARVREPFLEVFAGLLARAQEAGAVRRDVTADDVLTLVCGTFALPAAQAPEARARLSRVIADGLRGP